MSVRFNKTFSILALLVLTTLAGVAFGLMATPSRNAKQLASLIDNSELIGGNSYLAEETLAALNEKISGKDSDIPPCTHSFTTEIIPASWLDLCMLRQPMVIKYTSNPIPPAYQGPITRHTVTYFVRLKDVHQIEHSEKVLFEYFE